jgi:hypothetical protein
MDMHTALMALGLAVAIAAIWHAPLAAQTEEPYGGPSSISFMANGMLAPTRSGLVDLTTGAADVAGPCPPGRRCGPSDQRHLTLAPSDLAKLRSLAIEVRAEGLFDTGCIERQRKEAEEEPEKKQAEWKRQHPNGPPMPATILTPPLDPFFASLQIEGVGTVVSAPALGNRKSDARCVTPATQTLWNMVMGL